MQLFELLVELLRGKSCHSLAGPRCSTYILYSVSHRNVRCKFAGQYGTIGFQIHGTERRLATRALVLISAIERAAAAGSETAFRPFAKH